MSEQLDSINPIAVYDRQHGSAAQPSALQFCY